MKVRASLALAAVGAAPLVVLVAASLWLEVPKFFDPCHAWGSDARQVRLEPDGPCAGGRSASSETRGAAAARMLLIQGGIAAAAALALVGGARQRPLGILVATLILFLEAIPLLLGSWAILPLTSAAVFLFAARATQRLGPWTGPFLTALGAVGAAAGLGLVAAVLYQAAVGEIQTILFSVLLAVPLLFAGLAAWPRRLVEIR